MILADEPAYALPPISRAMKFDDFDRLLAKAVQSAVRDVPGGFKEEGRPDPQGSGPSVNRHFTPVALEAGNYWEPGPTLLGGYEGEVAMAVPGAVPVTEI